MQLEELMESLDKNEMEVALYRELSDYKDEIKRQMELTESITNQYKGNKKSYLELENSMYLLLLNIIKINFYFNLTLFILFKLFLFVGLIQKMKKERQEKEEEERKEKERQDAEEMVRKIHEDPESITEKSTTTSEPSDNKISEGEDQSSKTEKLIDGEGNASEPKVENGNAIKTDNEDMEVDEIIESVDKDGK